MTRLKMFCFSLANENLAKIKKINYIPVGLGKGNFDSEWLRDNTGDNISEKNSWYGENTFYYWLWKNNLKKLLSSDAVLFKEKINLKSPGTRADKLHQDSQAGWSKYAKEFVSVIISLQDSNKHNSPLEVDISGRNHKRLIKKKFKINKTL